MKVIIDTNTGTIMGYSNGDFSPGPHQAVIDAPDGFSVDTAAEYVFDGQTLVHDPSAYLARVKHQRKTELKRAAQQAIEALTWRLQRAQERDALGLPGETVQEVLLEREAIRRASNRLEAEIDAALDADAVRQIAFAVTEADRATPARLTRLQFLGRFTDAEMQAIVAAADASPALKAALLKWQTAEGIVLTDPLTQAGVQALEMAGLIAAGRAAQILTINP